MSRTITVTVINEYGKQPLRLLHESGRAVLPTMRESGMELPALCDGIGKCGRCRVQFETNAPLPTPTERAILEPELLRQGYRLACMTRPTKDCKIRCAFEQEPKPDVVTGHSVPEQRCAAAQESADTAEEYTEQPLSRKTLIAVDIGTTTIAMQLLGMEHGERLKTYTCLNPQRRYGMDVISRVKAAMEGADVVLRELVEKALREGVYDLQEAVIRWQKQGVEMEEPRWMCIACNTVMGHLFLGYDVSGLGKSPFHPVSLAMEKIRWEGMNTIVLPGFSAFVGGDVVAGLYACDVFGNREKEAAQLFIDLGTNAEMVICAGGHLACTAAAAGPAFEGKGRAGAMGADRILAIAQLLEQHLMDETGLLADPYFTDGIEVEIQEARDGERKSVLITQEDIRQIQMAKAAVRSGLHFLMEKLELKDFGQIERVYVAGGFGFFLNKKAAVRIGLLPSEAEDKTRAVGNTALAGAGLLGRKLAVDFNIGKEAMEILGNRGGEENEIFNLAEEKEFEKIYMKYINFPTI